MALRLSNPDMTESLQDTRNYQHFICFLHSPKFFLLSGHFFLQPSADLSHCPLFLGNLSFGSLLLFKYITPGITLGDFHIHIWDPPNTLFLQLHPASAIHSNIQTPDFVCTCYYNSSLNYKHLTFHLLPFIIPVHFFPNTPTPKMIKPH